SGHLVTHRDLALLGEIHLHELDHTRRQLVRLQDAIDPLLRPLLQSCLLVVGGVDDAANLLVDASVLYPEGLEIQRSKLEPAKHRFVEPGSGGDRLFSRASAQGQRNSLSLEQLNEFSVADLVHAKLLVRLEPAHLTDTLAS